MHLVTYRSECLLLVLVSSSSGGSIHYCRNMRTLRHLTSCWEKKKKNLRTSGGDRWAVFGRWGRNSTVWCEKNFMVQCHETGVGSRRKGREHSTETENTLVYEVWKPGFHSNTAEETREERNWQGLGHTFWMQWDKGHQEPPQWQSLTFRFELQGRWLSLCKKWGKSEKNGCYLIVYWFQCS